MIFLKNSVKVIFHIDLNQFFCSVAMLKNPRLKGKAFAIGRENTTRGVLSTASYEARKYGIHAGMPVIEALRILPSLIIVGYSHELYHEHSKRFFSLLREYVKDIEQTSIDEGYLDVTDITLKINRHPMDLAKEIQNRALKELSLPCSIGIAPTLFLAKMASDLKKPLGITILRIRDVKEKLGHLSVSEIFGIGKKTYPILIDKGIKTIDDFMNPSNKEIILTLMSEHLYLHYLSALNGKSDNQVNPYRYAEPESISHSLTYDTPLTNHQEIVDEILRMSEQLHESLKRHKKRLKTVGITLRDTNFKTITRSKTLNEYTDNKTVINYYLEELVDLHYHGDPFRLVGASYSNLKDEKDLIEEITLFNYQSIYEKEEALLKLMNDFDERFGKNSLFFGKDLKKEDTK